MSNRPLLAPNQNEPLIDGESMGADITGPVTIIQMLPGISYDLSWTGTPTGNFQVQVSNSYAKNPDGSVKNAGHWTTIPEASFSGSYPAAAGASGGGFIDVVGTECYAVRLVYVRSSGTGALTVYPAAKVL